MFQAMNTSFFSSEASHRLIVIISHSYTRMSSAWEFSHFSICTIAQCNMYHFLFLSGNTTNFRNHLVKDHPEVLNEPSEPHRGSLGPSGRPSLKQATLPTMMAGSDSSRMRSGPLSKERQEEITGAIVTFILAALLPLCIIENRAFIQLLKVLEPRYTLDIVLTF